MQTIKPLVAASWLVLSTIAWGAPETTSLEAGQHLKRNVFSGEESRISAYNLVLTDCSSGPLPAVRVVKAPAQGAVRFNPTRIPIRRDGDSPLAHCNGMQAEALGVYYKAPENFAGVEQLTIDADWRNGNISRFVYTITVR